MKRRTATKTKATTRRRRPAAKKNSMKPLLIGAAVIGGGYLAYQYIIKPMLDKSSEDQEPGALDTAVQTSVSPGSILTAAVQTVANIPAGTVQLNTSKTINPGAGTSPELKAAKIAFNDVMTKAERGAQIWNPSMKISRERLQAIADLRKGLAGTGGLLDPDTEYGSYSQNVANVILGKKSFTLNDVRSQRASLYNALNLPNPY